MLKVGLTQLTVICGVPVEDKIFNEELVDYRLVDREEYIDELIGWISEIGYFNQERASDKLLMKQDLKYLMGLEDEFVFSAIGTNEFIAQSDSPDKFKEICKDILVESGLTEAGAEDALSGECLD